MKSISLLTLLIIIVLFNLMPRNLLFAQAPDTMWTKRYGDKSYAYCVQQTFDEGYIIGGNVGIYPSDAIWLIKTDSSGDSLWSKILGTSHYHEKCRYTQQTSDRGYIIAGFIHTNQPGSMDALLIKTDEFGDTLWTRTYGDSGVMDDFFSVKETNDGGYVITGGTNSMCDTWDLWIVKTDAFGDTQWTNTFDLGYIEVGKDIQLTSDGGYIIAGMIFDYTPGQDPNDDALLIKVDHSGEIVWTKRYGGMKNDDCPSVQQTSDEGYILAGMTGSYCQGFSGFWLIKTNDIGDTLWTRTYGGLKYPDCDEGHAVSQTSDGGFIITGIKYLYPGSDPQNVWVVKTDAYGDTIWTKTIGGNSYDMAYSISQTSDGGYILGGETHSFSKINESQIWLIKLSPDISNISLGKDDFIINEIILHQNYPNPFNPTTTIEFDLPTTSEVTLKIFNLLGEEVTTLVSDRLTAGNYSYQWNAGKLASGVYLYRLEAGEFVETRKMVLMR